MGGPSPVPARSRGNLTINDVARVAGVSKKTVSRVINRETQLKARTREHVEGVIAMLGYTPNPQARALALGRNFLIGLVHDNPNAQTVMSVQQGILEALRDTEFEMIVRPLDRGSPTMLDEFRDFIERQRLFGVVLMPPISENDMLARLCEEAGCRYVRMGSTALDTPDRMVASNDREGVRTATDYLIGLGHRRIALIAGPQGFRSARERRMGFEQALGDAGIALPSSWVAEGDYLFGSGVAAAERLFALEPRPTAIFSCNDEMAAGAIHAARAQGLDVPGDLSVIGFDDNPIAAHMWPPITTVRWPIASMARSAALKLVFERSQDGADEPSLFLSTLIRRGSVGTPR
ncbi:LacI family transcriptional regulator [Sphingomonas panacisoli]|uniref:LacI family transcriptional regulator n=1 Tax=Sphingomonas panacisoli TaxID=1813879 RepID=A0A5B8LJG3_9SPHN|nr:LacI family DNA-binding transcriptional regulator [Sphingomonas panacisoli]QDZ07895.1 LacI family transcriptional regulator [Sphingomonas panacisoli]